MVAKEGDVFRLLCAVLARQEADIGCLDARMLRNPAIASALIGLAQSERVAPALHEVVAAHPDWDIAACSASGYCVERSAPILA